jgi:hypothetical protein
MIDITDLIEIDGYYYNPFYSKEKCHVIIWDNEKPIDNFDLKKFDGKIWTAWTCNTISEKKIKLRKKFEKYINQKENNY